MTKLAIDAMGGDFAPEEIVKGVNLAIKDFSDLELVLFGDTEAINKFLIPNDRVKIVHAPTKIDMGEKDPIGEIRRNRDTSLVKAFQAVKDKEVDGVVTAGPTQAVISAAHLIIRRIKGMKRVALCPTMPVIGDKARLLLDVGANVELRSEHLVQLAEYATIYLREVKGVKDPVIGLLNIGTEPGKGREVDKETYYALEADKNIHFFGNVEPKELFFTECDALITDGFTGNMVIKTCEGSAKAIGAYLKKEIKASFFAKIGYVFMNKVFKNFKKTMNSDEIGGAVLFGVDGTVIKSHGSSNSYAFYKAIEQAKNVAEAKVAEKMKKVLEESSALDGTEE